MTSGEFKSVPIGAIWVNRETRIRREITLAQIDDLADSIQRLGLFHPPIITREMELKAGETRWLACKKLGWTHIPIQFVEDASQEDLLAIELEENVKRNDLSWQEKALAVEKYHALRSASEPEWSTLKTADALGYTRQHIDNQLKAARELQSGNEKVKSAERLSTAVGVISRAEERKRDSQLAKLFERTSTPPPGEQAQEVKSTIPYVVCADFIKWAADYRGDKFNFLHCDFPYGIGIDESDQAGGATRGAYRDTYETYVGLLEALAVNIDNILSPSAHIIFWFSMEYHAETVEFFSKNIPSVELQKHPLVWVKSDGRGILPDPTRGPRRIYETALFGSRGDRKVVQSVGNAYVGPIAKSETLHLSEKSKAMLEHFFRMVVDEHTHMLDPTCGSGSALRAAAGLGAARYLGIEAVPEYAAEADAALKKSLLLLGRSKAS